MDINIARAKILMKPAYADAKSFRMIVRNSITSKVKLITRNVNKASGRLELDPGNKKLMNMPGKAEMSNTKIICFTSPISRDKIILLFCILFRMFSELSIPSNLCRLD
jgi:hypothetical protein